jgi:hypothetical protein
MDFILDVTLPWPKYGGEEFSRFTGQGNLL